MSSHFWSPFFSHTFWSSSVKSLRARASMAQTIPEPSNFQFGCRVAGRYGKHIRSYVCWRFLTSCHCIWGSVLHCTLDWRLQAFVAGTQRRVGLGSTSMLPRLPWISGRFDPILANCSSHKLVGLGRPKMLRTRNPFLPHLLPHNVQLDQKSGKHPARSVQSNALQTQHQPSPA